MATRAERLRRRRAKGLKPRAPRLPAQQFPEQISNRYIRELRKRVEVLRKAMERKLLPVIEEQAEGRADSTRADVDAELERLIFDLIGEVVFSYERRIPDPRELVQRIARNVDKFNRKQIERQVGSVIGIDVLETSDFVDIDFRDWLSDNVDLIQDVTDKYREQVSDIVVQGFREGKRPETIAKELVERGDITERRARLIARDQIEKLNAKITERRHKSLGVESYTWRTSLDSRVRPSHREREGKVYRYDDPPEDGNPGEPILCRCRAEPNTEELIARLEAEVEAESGGTPGN